jgi:2-phosphosulfolactate phosphatase
VIAAGERWPDGSLRPAVEDSWGAGALVCSLLKAGWTGASPEALAVAAAFDAVTDVAAALRGCGQDLIRISYADDVATAAHLDEGTTVPLLDHEAFRPA